MSRTSRLTPKHSTGLVPSRMRDIIGTQCRRDLPRVSQSGSPLQWSSPATSDINSVSKAEWTGVGRIPGETP